MATLDDAINYGRRGLRAVGAAATSAGTVPPTAGGAVPPPGTPLPTIDPALADAAPAAQGFRATSPEGQAFQASRAAAPAATPAAAAGEGLGYRAGQAVTQGAAKLGITPEAAVGGLRGVARSGIIGDALLSTAGDIKDQLQTGDTSRYEKRFGLDGPANFEDSTLGRIGAGLRDSAVRGLGLAGDLATNIGDVGTSVVNAIRPGSLRTFRDILDNGADGAPATQSAAPATQPAAPAPTPFAALSQPQFDQGAPGSAPVTPAAPGSNLDRAKILDDQLQAQNQGGGLRSPQALSTFNQLQTARNNGISATRLPNGQVSLSNDPNARTSPVPDTGVRFASDADISRLQNASPTAPSDPNSLFSTTNGAASSFGTPLANEPRMQVSGDSSIGGRIERRQQERQFQHQVQQQELGLRGQDLALRRQQFGAEFGLRGAELQRQISHDQATTGIARDQLAREGLRDTNTAQNQRAQLQRETNRDQLEYGFKKADLGLRASANQRAGEEADFKQRTDAEDNFSKRVAGQLPVDPTTGKPNPGDVAEHVSNANAVVSSRVAQLQQQLKLHPDDQTAATVLDNYQRKGLDALSDTDKQRVQAQTEFGQLARQYGSGPLNPIGGRAESRRTPIASIQHESGLTGSVYRGYDANGKATPLTVPARAIDGDGSFVGGVPNSRFNILKQKGQ